MAAQAVRNPWATTKAVDLSFVFIHCTDNFWHLLHKTSASITAKCLLLHLLRHRLLGLFTPSLLLSPPPIPPYQTRPYVQSPPPPPSSFLVLILASASDFAFPFPFSAPLLLRRRPPPPPPVQLRTQI
ncbi:unnamed protein product [Hydatigera taeniaeformis]|uniref:Uncharacterized protein n=1 Tax=Hydatigena taeniaeformis TaxID=6205 RepID=A0A0R3X987_HYDTA|nr:unnamed protein product [Hydatigera taeniaeformis]